MRIFLVLICSFALVCTVRGDAEKKPTSQPSQRSATHGGHAPSGDRGSQGTRPSQHGEGSKHAAPGGPKHPAPEPANNAAPQATKQVVPGGAPSSGAVPAVQAQPSQRVREPAATIPVQPAAPPRPRTQKEINEDYAHGRGFPSFDQYQNWKQTGRIEGPSGVVRPWHAQHFDVAAAPDPTIEGVKFQGTGHIEGSEAWSGKKYAAFRDYHHEWHDKDWWEHPRPNDLAPSPSAKPSPSPKASGSPKPTASTRPSATARPTTSPTPSASPTASPTPTPSPSPTLFLVSGGWYFRNGCYWYPAWGYDPNYTYYPYDGPIYSCVWPPDQTIANVQARLTELGYYYGPINGLLSPATRAAVANYQYDRGLYITSAIDEATIESLGIA